MEASGQLQVPAALPLGRSQLILIGYEAGWVPEPVWRLWRTEKSCPYWDSNVGRLDLSPSLYWPRCFDSQVEEFSKSRYLGVQVHLSSLYEYGELRWVWSYQQWRLRVLSCGMWRCAKSILPPSSGCKNKAKGSANEKQEGRDCLA
jgi:hypothetical protein